jgi:hypothetical protein
MQIKKLLTQNGFTTKAIKLMKSKGIYDKFLKDMDFENSSKKFIESSNNIVREKKLKKKKKNYTKKNKKPIRRND